MYVGWQLFRPYDGSLDDSKYSPALSHVINGMLHPSPEKRLTAQEVLHTPYVQWHLNKLCHTKGNVLTHLEAMGIDCYPSDGLQ